MWVQADVVYPNSTIQYKLVTSSSFSIDRHSGIVTTAIALNRSTTHSVRSVICLLTLLVCSGAAELKRNLSRRHFGPHELSCSFTLLTYLLKLLETSSWLASQNIHRVVICDATNNKRCVNSRDQASGFKVGIVGRGVPNWGKVAVAHIQNKAEKAIDWVHPLVGLGSLGRSAESTVFIHR